MDKNKIKQYLFEAYGGFADKRIKNLDKGVRFIVDDRGPNDYAADKSLYLWFCSVCVEVHAADHIDVLLAGGLPKSAALDLWLKSHGVDSSTQGRSALRIVVPVTGADMLDELAEIIAATVKPGVRYSEKSYKYVCPRTAASLRRLGVHLRKLNAPSPPP